MLHVFDHGTAVHVQAEKKLAVASRSFKEARTEAPQFLFWGGMHMQ